jgi:hypothetical protein
MQSLSAGADRTKCATVGSRCSRVARQHRWGKAQGTCLSSEAKAMCLPIGEGSDGGWGVMPLGAGLEVVFTMGGQGQDRVNADGCGWD